MLSGGRPTPSRRKEQISREDDKLEQYRRTLSDLLARLKVDRSNPDLWMEAASIYMALGKGDRALKATRASLKVAEARGNEDALVARLRRLLHGDDVPASEDEGEPRGESGVRQDRAPEPVVRETRVRSRTPVCVAADMEGPSLAGEREALEQLRRELSPRETVTCPECHTLLEVGDPWCHGCGQEMREGGESLEERVGLARARLKEDEDDADALFTLAAHLAVRGHHEEALEHLIRLTAQEPRYPGLWWVKARVFLDAGKTEAARSSVKMALEIWTARRREPRT